MLDIVRDNRTLSTYRGAKGERSMTNKIPDSTPQRDGHDDGMARQQGRETASAKCDEQSITTCTDCDNEEQMLTGDGAFDDECVFRTDRGEQTETKQQTFDKNGGV